MAITPSLAPLRAKNHAPMLPARAAAPNSGGDEAMLAALDAWGRPAAILGRNKRVVGLNLSAEALMGDGVLISQNRLRASTRSCDAALQALLEDAVADTSPHRAFGLALPRRHGRPLMVHGAALPGEVGAALASGRALVTFTRLDTPTGAGADLIAHAYGLTSAEQTLCRHLVSGAGLPEAARAQGVSMSTVRTHLKGVFLKTETHRQSELVALLAQAGCSLWTGSTAIAGRGNRSEQGGKVASFGSVAC